MVIAGSEGFHKPLCCNNCPGFCLRTRAKEFICLSSCSKCRAPNHTTLITMLHYSARKGHSGELSTAPLIMIHLLEMHVLLPSMVSFFLFWPSYLLLFFKLRVSVRRHPSEKCELGFVIMFHCSCDITLFVSFIDIPVRL